MTEITPPRYQWSYQGVSFDFYRLCEILGIKNHAQTHALKKVIRAGQSVKPLVQDIDEAIACLQRWREMAVEDAAKGEATAEGAIQAMATWIDAGKATFPDPPPGRKWHNPHNSTPDEVGVSEGWRLRLIGERANPRDEILFGGWRKSWIDQEFVLTEENGTPYRTKEPLPA